MNCQDHLICLRCIGQRRILVAEPQEFLFPVALADIYAELDQRLVDHIFKSIRLRGIGGAFNRDGTLVVGVAGGAPAAVFLFHVHADPAIHSNAVIAGSLPGCRREDTAERFHGALADHTVWRDPVNAVGALPGVVRTELGVDHQRAVRICHYSSPPFSARS